GNNEALKIETARRRIRQIRQYPGMGLVEIIAYKPSHVVNSADPRVNLRFTARRDPGGMRLSRRR
ncbi:MAG: hypothetical protein ACE1ZS_08370, partial [Candidatus Poribacteria bacterium]